MQFACIDSRAQFFASDTLLLCDGDEITISLDTALYDTVTWIIPGDTLIDSFQVVFSAGGLHVGEATDTNGNIFTDSVFIDLILLPGLSVPDEKICRGILIALEVSNSSQFDSVIWNDTLYKPVIILDDSGTHMVSAWTLGCEVRDTVRIDTCNSTLDILPNVFSPNGDGINDFLDYKGENFSVFVLHIYDRWGNEVFQSSSGSLKWDGMTSDGLEAQAGVYYWTLRYRLLTRIMPETVETSGTVTLLR